MEIIDVFNFADADEVLELAAKTLCAMRGKDPNATNNTGNQEWISFLHEAKEHLAVYTIFQRQHDTMVHRRIVHNGHIQDVDIVDETRPD